MIKNDQREALSFGSSMGCNVSLAQVYLDVACDVVNLSKKYNDLSMNSYILYNALLFLWYLYYPYVFISYDYVYCWLTPWDILCLVW